MSCEECEVSIEEGVPISADALLLEAEGTEQHGPREASIRMEDAPHEAKPRAPQPQAEGSEAEKLEVLRVRNGQRRVGLPSSALWRGVGPAAHELHVVPLLGL